MPAMGLTVITRCHCPRLMYFMTLKAADDGFHAMSMCISTWQSSKETIYIVVKCYSGRYIADLSLNVHRLQIQAALYDLHDQHQQVLHLESIFFTSNVNFDPNTSQTCRWHMTKNLEIRVFEWYQTWSKRKYWAWKTWKSMDLLKYHIPASVEQASISVAHVVCFDNSSGDLTLRCMMSQKATAVA